MRFASAAPGEFKCTTSPCNSDGAAGCLPLTGDRAGNRGAAAADQPVQTNDFTGGDVE